jgi:hypothetical protein
MRLKNSLRDANPKPFSTLGMTMQPSYPRDELAAQGASKCAAPWHRVISRR